jgi:hypothetical protein
MKTTLLLCALALCAGAALAKKGEDAKVTHKARRGGWRGRL